MVWGVGAAGSGREAVGGGGSMGRGAGGPWGSAVVTGRSVRMTSVVSETTREIVTFRAVVSSRAVIVVGGPSCSWSEKVVVVGDGQIWIVERMGTIAPCLTNSGRRLRSLAS